MATEIVNNIPPVRAGAQAEAPTEPAAPARMDTDPQTGKPKVSARTGKVLKKRGRKPNAIKRPPQAVALAAAASSNGGVDDAAGGDEVPDQGSTPDPTALQVDVVRIQATADLLGEVITQYSEMLGVWLAGPDGVMDRKPLAQQAMDAGVPGADLVASESGNLSQRDLYKRAWMRYSVAMGWTSLPPWFEVVTMTGAYFAGVFMQSEQARNKVKSFFGIKPAAPAPQ